MYVMSVLMVSFFLSPPNKYFPLPFCYNMVLLYDDEDAKYSSVINVEVRGQLMCSDALVQNRYCIKADEVSAY